jgi:hypothetical protein
VSVETIVQFFTSQIARLLAGRDKSFTVQLASVRSVNLDREPRMDVIRDGMAQRDTPFKLFESELHQSSSG